MERYSTEVECLVTVFHLFNLREICAKTSNLPVDAEQYNW